MSGEMTIDMKSPGPSSAAAIRVLRVKREGGQLTGPELNITVWHVDSNGRDSDGQPITPHW